MTVVKALNLASYACQLLAVCLATKIDLKAFALGKVTSELPNTIFVDQYLAVSDGKQHFPSEAELNLLALEAANDEKRNGALLRWSGALIAFAIVLQTVATCISPD